IGVRVDAAKPAVTHLEEAHGGAVPDRSLAAPATLHEDVAADDLTGAIEPDRGPGDEVGHVGQNLDLGKSVATYPDGSVALVRLERAAGEPLGLGSTLAANGDLDEAEATCRLAGNPDGVGQGHEIGEVATAHLIDPARGKHDEVAGRADRSHAGGGRHPLRFGGGAVLLPDEDRHL